MAVHQECYGANNVQDFTSWVCRVCETPDVERECCLCPVKGTLFTPSIFCCLTLLYMLMILLLHSTTVATDGSNALVFHQEMD